MSEIPHVGSYQPTVWRTPQTAAAYQVRLQQPPAISWFVRLIGPQAGRGLRGREAHCLGSFSIVAGVPLKRVCGPSASLRRRALFLSPKASRSKRRRKPMERRTTVRPGLSFGKGVLGIVPCKLHCTGLRVGFFPRYENSAKGPRKSLGCKHRRCCGVVQQCGLTAYTLADHTQQGSLNNGSCTLGSARVKGSPKRVIRVL